MQVASADSCRTRETDGVGTVELVCVAGLLTMGGESFLLLCGVWICWRWVYWQREVGCEGDQGSYQTDKKPSWQQNGLPCIVNIMQIVHG